jgi:hypothetical protein
MLRTLGGLILSSVLTATALVPSVSGQCGAGTRAPAPNVQQGESPGSQVAQIPEPEFKKWLQETTDLLSKLNETLNVPMSRPIDIGELPKFTPAERQAEDKLLKMLREICLTYLRAGAEQRESIRRMFDGKEAARWFLAGYPSYAAEEIHSKADVEWVLVGLAAVSIEDNRRDFRDTYVALGDLYVIAFKAGIAPGDYFKQVALLSSRTEIEEGYGSMYDFLLGFEKSAFFKFEVKPKLPRKREAN